MVSNIKFIFVMIFLVVCSKPFSALADVYGGGFWEAIGLGNMQCNDFITKVDNDVAYQELGAVWLSGFMSGINFTSSDVYDITWGEDLYVLADLITKRCRQHPDKLVSDIATEMVYKRYKEKNFTPASEVNN